MTSETETRVYNVAPNIQEVVVANPSQSTTTSIQTQPHRSDDDVARKQSDDDAHTASAADAPAT